MFIKRKINGVDHIQVERTDSTQETLGKPLADMSLDDWKYVLKIVKENKYDTVNRATSKAIEYGTFDYTCLDGKVRTFSTKKENQDNASAQATAIISGLLDPTVHKVRFEHNEKKGAYYRFTTKTEFLAWWLTGMSKIDDIYFGGKDINTTIMEIGNGETDTNKFIDHINAVLNYIDTRFN